MAGRLFVTGDTHGSIDVRKLGRRRFREGCSLDKDDYLIIAGDFGCVWDGSKEDEYWLDWLEDLPYTVLFVDGNHENFDLLDAMDIEEWHGGLVHFVRPHVIHLMRGQLFDLFGLSVFTMGGARSHDVQYRVEGRSWWRQEMPASDEKDAAWEALSQTGWKVDLVVTHCAPQNLAHRINPAFGEDSLTVFLFDIERSLDYGLWVFGHYHEDIPDLAEHASALYRGIYEVKSDLSLELAI